jgi:NIPSNAP
MKVLKTFLGIVTALVILNSNDMFSQQLGDKVYWMSTVEVSISKLQSYYTFNAKELVPLMEESGYTPVASWQTIVGDIEEVIFVAEFENMEAYHNARKNLLSNIDWPNVSRKLDSLIKSVHTRLLSAAPF